jgi:glycosyltransferase involved in cell wall biosynthesis
VLKELAAREDFAFVVIADKRPDFEMDNLEFVRWNKDSEIDDLLRFDIGIMPLPDTEWARGKCGFKILQYMALGIPAVASPVGVNSNIIHHGHDGYLCNEASDWSSHLALLLHDPDLRETLGGAGRQNVIDCYSLKSNAAKFLASLGITAENTPTIADGQ